MTPLQILGLELRRRRRARAAPLEWSEVRAVVAQAQPEFRQALDGFEAGHVPDHNALRILSVLCSFTEDHTGYEDMMARHDGTFDPGTRNFAKRRFTGLAKGFGIGSLNAHRLLETEATTLFEKIYFTDSLAFAAVSEFHDSVRPLLAGRISTPALVEIRSGRALAALRFEAVDMGRQKEMSLDRVLACARALKDIDVAPLIGRDKTGRRLDFERHFKMERIRPVLMRRLAQIWGPQNESVRAALEACRDHLRTYPRVLCHGDLHTRNLARSGDLIDWDDFGFFPFGFDEATIACMHKIPRDLESTQTFFRAHVDPHRQSRANLTAFLYFTLHLVNLKTYPEVETVVAEISYHLLDRWRAENH